MASIAHAPNARARVSDESETSLLRGPEERASTVDFGVLPLRPNGAGPLPAMSNLVKSLLGAGILSVANAFSHAGLAWGIGIYIVVGVGVTAGNLALISVKHELNRRGRLDVETFSDVGGAVLGWWGSFLVSAQIVFLELAFATGFVVVILNQLASTVGLSQDLGSRTLAAMALAVPLAMLANVRWLKDLWPISVLGLIVYAAGIIGMSVFQSAEALSLGPEPQRVQPTATGLALFTGVAVYANEGINLILPVETSLADRRHAYWVTAVGMSSYNALCAAMGALAFAAGLGRCELITNCFRDGASALVVQWALMVALLATHPLQLYPASELIERRLGIDADDADADAIAGETRPAGSPKAAGGARRSCGAAVSRVALRAGLATFTCLLGALVPNFPLLADVVGSLVMTLVGFVLPVVLYAKLFWSDMRWYGWVAGGASVVFGLVTCVFGTVTSVDALIKGF